MVESSPSASSTPSSLEDPKILAAAAYLLGGIGGYGFGYLSASTVIGLLLPLGIYMWKKTDAFIAFHAFQAFLWTVVVAVVGFVLGTVLLAQTQAAYANPYAYAYGGGFGATLGLSGIFLMVGLVILVVDLFLAYKAYKGDKFKLPVLGAMAEKPFL